MGAPLMVKARNLSLTLSPSQTMMNDACPVCHTPMMRSPDRTQLICVLNHPQESRAGTAGESSGSKASSNSTISIGGSTSRPSTPPTPLSDSHDSDNFVMPPPSEETLRRRQQSDLASQRIGAKMLQGYAMLAEECLNPDCIGVPLIRPPKPGSKDPHKECVICNNVYVEVLDSRGHASLQLVSPPLPASTDPIQPQSSRSTIAPGPPVEDRSLSGPWHTVLGRGTADLKAKHKPFDDIVSRPSANTQTIAADKVLGDVLASVDKSLGALSSRLNFLSDAEPSMLNSTLLGEAATQMGILLGVREAAMRQMADSST
ncbi:hypothetical protein FRB93_003285 [Tulasnella sp. JGI-2019a]|nr:hypothetical protein FRB93_003285 [Tulasnella sp. JGI-2019a]